MAITEKSSSRWFQVEKVPENYIVSLEDRPGELNFPVCETIPVIEIGKAMNTAEERINTVHHILKAAEEFGFFQVINHGIPENMVADTTGVFREFFDKTDENLQRIGQNTNGWFFSGSTVMVKGGVCLWRDNIKHPCHPLEDCMPFWPQEPSRYKEVVAAYLIEIRKLSSKILEMICEGLGLETGFFELSSEVQLLSASNYPPCPDPTLTLGLLKHRDPSLLTILYQGDVGGLQVLKNAQWVGIPTLPSAFLVNIGNQLEIISNGKLKSAEHRVVTSSSQARTSIATFINPSPSCIIEPAKVLVSEANPACYKSTMYKDYVNSSKAFGPSTDAIQNHMTSFGQSVPA